MAIRACRFVWRCYWFWVEGCVPFCGAAVVIGSGCGLVLAVEAGVLVFSSLRIKSRALWESQSYFRAVWVSVESGTESPSTALIWSKQEYNRTAQTQTNRKIRTTDTNYSQCNVSIPQNSIWILDRQKILYKWLHRNKNTIAYSTQSTVDKIRCFSLKLSIHWNPPKMYRGFHKTY